MLVAGTLLAGTPDRPLETDCYIGISFKDHQATFAARMWQEVGEKRGFIGFEIVPGAKVRVHSADSAKARLVFACHQKDGAGDSGKVPDKQSQPDQWRVYDNLPRRINMVIWKDADVQFNGVVFSDMEKHGIKLQDMAMKDTWQNVFYGQNNAAPPEELYVRHEPTLEGRGAYSFPIETVVKGELVGGDTLFVKDAGTPVFKTPAGWYPKGQTVNVTLASENSELVIRYTLDGAEPAADAMLYDGPIAVTRDVVIKAASFKDGNKRGETTQAEYRFSGSGDSKFLPAHNPETTRPGLSYKYYEGDWKQIPDFDELQPVRQGVATELDLNAIKHRSNHFGLVLEGSIHIPRTGQYTLYVTTAKEDACRVYIDGQRVIDNDMSTLQSMGLIAPEQGPHRLKVVFVERGWGQHVRLRFRRIDDSSTHDVTAKMLTH
jgi:hypothetical protein